MNASATLLPAAGDMWVQEFGIHTPSEAVAGFLAAHFC
ncbi:DUF317 domain-containing protein [Streptomyces sp. NPDC002533]